MRNGMQWMAALSAALLLTTAWPALAQQQGSSPFQLQNPQKEITSPQGRAASQDMLTTKPSNAPALPWVAPAPVQVTAPGQQATPAPLPAANPYKNMPSPFGKATASQYQPIPEGPHTTVAVPVENIDMIETSEPAPATPAAHVADPANEDPAAPTELTAPIFAEQQTMIPRSAFINVLNKVTARGQRITIKPGETVTVGKLQITATHCQLSAENSLPDAAALLEISEILPDVEKPKLLFSGWMYQSSPSVSALEHPVYDVTLLNCKDTQAKEKPAEKDKKSAKKKR